ncbi:MAG: ferredoxin, partial [Pseudomonadota bacterium]
MSERLAALLAAEGLAVVGHFQPGPGDGASGAATLALVGARGDALWPHFSQSPEAQDGAPEPLDRWSRRVLERIAAELGAEAFFPFGGPPYMPFISWAAKAEGARVSPVAMQVSPRRGLWMSYRGALGLREAWAPAPELDAPCDGCPRPCVTACPVNAFATGGYDIPKCLDH